MGAEGTLGLITEITLKLAVIPQETSVAVVPFPSVYDAASAAAKLMRSGIQLAALEIMDEMQMRVINRSGGAASKRRWAESPTLFLKSEKPMYQHFRSTLTFYRFSGTKETIKNDIERVAKIVADFNAGSFIFAGNKQEELDLWSARKEALWAMLSQRPSGTEIWSTDVAVPLSRMAEIIGILS